MHRNLFSDRTAPLISAAVHLGAVLALLLIGVSADTKGVIEITWKEAEDTLEPLTLDLLGFEPEGIEDSSEGLEAFAVIIPEAIAETVIEIPDLGSQSWSPPPPIVFSDESFQAPEESNLTTGETGNAEAAGAFKGKGSGNGRGSTFFGIRSEETRVVFVLDASLSMAGARWNRLVEEMGDTVSALNEEMEFSIIFFNTRYQEIEAGLQVATDQNKSNAIHWLRHYQPGGRTNPLPALTRALDLDPDAIYFLTDGDFQDFAVTRTLGRLKRQGASVSIHTIGLGNPAGNGKLLYLARASGGQFVFINH